MAEARRPVVARAVLRLREGSAGGEAGAVDEIAVEEPLEIRVAGDTVAITMRTPGEDRQLALGFLLAEGIISCRDDVGRVFHCGRPDAEDYGNVIDVAPGPGIALDPERTLRARRGTLTSVACGVCGRGSIEDLLERCTPLLDGPAFPLSLLTSSTAALHANQPHFMRTGGLHAAAVLDPSGRVLAVSEDVGRHNAVDKVIGTLLLEDHVRLRATRPTAAPPSLLVVSGRVSFEIVQKAVVAGIPVVCGVSAPTSLAIDLAERCRITLAGFVRDGVLNLYTHAERVRA